MKTTSHPCWPWLILAILSLGLPGWADGERPPAADAKKLAAFMERWKTPKAWQCPLEETDRPLILAALSKDPAGPWADYLNLVAMDTRAHLRDLRGEARKRSAADLLSILRQAQQILTTPSASSANQSPSSPRGENLRNITTFFQLEAGSGGLTEIAADAKRRLELNQDPHDWNYGNVVYEANDVLGRVALRQKRIDEARAHLRAAGRSPGSPQLGSFGPDYVLARELLERGTQEDREAVLAFVDDVAHFFGDAREETEANAKLVAKDHLNELARWRDEIRAGKVPDSRSWW